MARLFIFLSNSVIRSRWRVLSRVYVLPKERGKSLEDQGFLPGRVCISDGGGRVFVPSGMGDGQEGQSPPFPAHPPPTPAASLDFRKVGAVKKGKFGQGSRLHRAGKRIHRVTMPSHKAKQETSEPTLETSEPTQGTRKATQKTRTLIKQTSEPTKIFYACSGLFYGLAGSFSCHSGLLSCLHNTLDS